MVCFRGQRSRRVSLVISYLVIIPPEANELLTEFTFKHFYQAGPADQPRITQGLVLPLTGGIYLLGGQQAYGQTTNSFNTLKVVALPWRAVRSQELVLPGLFMSASRDDQHLVGRIALRPTGVTKHNEASIGLRHIDEIERYLIGLSTADSVATFAGRERAVRDHAGQAARIVELTNNQPREWDLVDVFKDSQGTELDRPTFETYLHRTFGRPNEQRYLDRRGQTFKFPDSLWLSPTTTDR